MARAWNQLCIVFFSKKLWEALSHGEARPTPGRTVKAWVTQLTFALRKKKQKKICVTPPFRLPQFYTAAFSKLMLLRTWDSNRRQRLKGTYESFLRLFNHLGNTCNFASRAGLAPAEQKKEKLLKFPNGKGQSTFEIWRFDLLCFIMG